MMKWLSLANRPSVDGFRRRSDVEGIVIAKGGIETERRGVVPHLRGKAEISVFRSKR